MTTSWFIRPQSRPARLRVLDVVATLVVIAVSLPNLAQVRDSRLPLAAAVLAVMTLPTLFRRIRPTAVFGGIFVVAVVFGLVDIHLVAAPALLAALYSVAALRPRREVAAAFALLELGVIAATIRVEGTHWWFDAIFLTGMVAAALGLGLYAATRRAYVAELHERAVRLERERDQQVERAAATERARIAREMHDIVAHHLTVMVALSDGAIASSTASPERAVEVMRTVSATGRQALADTRKLLGVLHEDSTEAGGDDTSLSPVPDLGQLDDLVARVRAAGLPVRLEVQGAAGDLPLGVQLTAYRLVQESLTNTMKHGGPGVSAVVRLRHLPGELCLEVEDDGAGATAPVPAGVGHGLAGMRERVQAFGGELQSGPGAARGWRVSARLHLDDMSPPDPATAGASRNPLVPG